MSKIFSKIRFETIKNANVKRYLIYAIGEIIIVVLGIFIAIYFNNLKEEKVNRKYVDEILKKIKEESENYIKSSVFFIDYNTKRDTLAQKILHDKIKNINDYKIADMTNIDVLQGIIQLNFDDTPLDNLNKRIDYLTEREKTIYNDLTLIKSYKKGYELNKKNVEKAIVDYTKFRKENNEWFYAITDDSVAIYKEFNYRRHSFRYKNFIRDFRLSEIISRTESYDFFQTASIRLLFRTIRTQTGKKRNAKQIDSILTRLNLKKATRIKCDTVFTHPEIKLFSGISMYQFIYNASSDTIDVKNEKNVLQITIPPKMSAINKYSLGEHISVFKKGECKAKYKNTINTYVIYE